MALFSFALAGCQNRTFSGGLTFLNESKKSVWVERTEGIKREYGVGILIPQANKGIIGYKSAAPHEVTLHWSYDYDRSDLRTTITVPPPPSRQAELQLAFTANESWTVSWKEK